MSTDEQKPGALVPAPPGRLAPVGAQFLATRGRSLLRNKEEAEEWLRRGLELQESAPADPWSRGPINPYGQYTLAAKLQLTIPAYLRLVSAGTPPDLAASIYRMSPDDQEEAHVAHFFMSDALERIANGPPERRSAASGQARVDVSSQKKNPIPSPAGMDDANLTQATMERVAKIAYELEELAKDEPRKLEQFKKHHAALSEALRCFEKGYELDPSNPELMYWLAESYRTGEVVQEDEGRALSLFQRAADMGYARAQTAIGDAYAHCGWDSGLEEDWVEAFKWYEAAAAQGDEDALCMTANPQPGTGIGQEHPATLRLARAEASVKRLKRQT